MLKIIESNKFKKDLRLANKRNYKIKKLIHIIEILAIENKLPAKNKAHKLSNNWDGFWECHIEPDWLLIYKYHDTSLYLVRTGTHSDLF